MYDVFSVPELKFPTGFLWGSATSAYQIEGNPPGPNGYDRCGLGANHWQMYREDVELMAQLGHQAYRFSINWARVEPEEGCYDEAALDHYDDLIDRLLARNIQPWVCLHHNLNPRWFEKAGAFSKRENLRHWERWVKKVVPRIAARIAAWMPFNEFNPHVKIDEGAYKLNCLKAHAWAYHFIRQHSDQPISHAHAFQVWEPRRPYDELDRRMADLADFMVNEFLFHAIRTGELVYPGQDGQFDPLVKGAMDFWGVNYYVRHLADARSASMEGPRYDHKRLRLIDVDNFFLSEFYPEGLLAALERLRDKPCYVSENGLAATDDQWRIVYVALHLWAIHEALQRGIDVRGYMYWSLLDNYEWGSFVPRFGLLEVDYETYRRTPRPSAAFLRDIIRDNALTPQTVKRYLPALPTLGR